VASRTTVAQFRAEPIINPDTVYELNGYSIQAPTGPNWFLMYQDKQSVSFGKKKFSSTHAFTATASSKSTSKKFKTLAEVINYVKEGNAASIDPDQQTIINNDAVTDEAAPAPLCVGYRLKTNDGRDPGTDSVLFTLSYGIVCVHPTIPNLLIDVGYSERGREEELNTKLVQNEGVGFVNSLKFSNTAQKN
jgi:hypothetical protein